MKRLLSITLLILGFAFCRAEFPQFSRFDKITQEDGLSSNHILSIFQERAGWMWIGTNLGLNRYDGYRFTVFKHGTAKGSLLGELVRCVYEDSKDRLWIGTERGGLNLFDREQESFSHLRLKDSAKDTIFSANSITEDENGRLWVGTNRGLAFLNDEGVLEPFPVAALAQAGNPEVNKLFFDRKNNLWIGTLAGLFVYDFTKAKGEFKPLPDTSKPSDEIHALFYDSDNILWIGTYNSGVYRANTNTGIITKVTDWVVFDRSETIRTIVEDNQGVIWFGTRGGLVSYDKLTQKYSSFLRDDDNGLSLSLNSILSLCLDSKGDLWIGTRGGVNYRDMDKQAFIHLYASRNDTRYLNNTEVYCVFVNGKDLLIGTESGGVNIYNMETFRFRYLTTKEGLSSDCVKWFAKDGNEILIGTYQGGITVVDAQTYKVKYLLQNHRDQPNSLPDNVVWGLLKDSRGRIWVATNRGVALYNSKNRTFTDYSDVIPSKQINWLKEDSEGDIWAGGGELYIFNPDTKKVIHYDEWTRDMLPVTDGKYWVATRGKGLALYDKKQGALQYYSEQNGLCNNTIQSLQRDCEGYIWLSTFNGLSRFDEKTGEFINFDASDGLQDNQFNYGAACSYNNNLIYGGINGVNIFDPSEIRKNFFVPPVVFTGLRIFNQPVKIGGAIKKSINVADTIELDYEQNVFSIEFAALSYSNSRKNEYSYMLEGFDREMIFAGTTNSVTYTNLNPGKYLFRVRGSNSNGIWSAKDATITIIIHPPFWQTWWFRLIVISLIALLLLYLGNFWLKRARLKNELVFEKTRARKLHEIETMKLRFFTNISHEIRTPLTLILGPLTQVIEQKNIDADAQNKLQLVKRNADQLLKLINQLLDFRKLEAGKQSVHYEKSDLVYFVQSIVESFNSLAVEKEIELDFRSERPQLFTWFDNDKIQKIVNNLLSNALKFTNNKGKISVEFSVNEGGVSEDGESQSSYTIVVRDTGKGISQSNLKKIFERFEQENNAQRSLGSGIGLSITREFVKLMNGDIDVESVEGKGAAFTVRLPLLQDADAGPEKDAERAEDKMFSENRKILLIVEDNPDVREYTASNFRSEYKVLEAENGKEGYEQAIEFIPDIIISDLLMPVMGGDALCRKLKKDERTSHIPVILLTAVNSKESEIESLKAGVDDYITKPFDVNILKLKVDNLLSLRDSLREKYRNDFLLQPTPLTLVSPDEKFLKKAVDIIEKNIGDPDFDIETFSAEIGASRMQLYRKMKALTNMTVKEFIRDIRIKRAAQLLEQNKLNVSEIVYSVGFLDMPYFRKCFREQYGCSPTEYAAKFK
ncbi:MAG: response regulator [Dysgonamonadaceae bacterium]|jgi:signal transduction histidine kinase/ligand-binding sensor domain-containing protein/DNA-binding response OmpR family regulator|nr:response regulator [Dysgonamonadaceae bacterium]